MAIYWLQFLLAGLASYAGGRMPAQVRKGFWVTAGIGLVVFVGLRHEVGGDWNSYLGYLESLRGVPFVAALGTYDPGYAVLNWVGANLFGGIYFVNTACAALAVSCLFAFSARQPAPALALLVAIPYLVTVVDMGYTRQSVAIGFGMMAMLAASERRPVLFLFWVTLAVLFHKAALCLFVFLPAMLEPGRERWRENLRRLTLMGAYGALLAALLFLDSLSQMWSFYVREATGVLDAEAPAALSSTSSEAGKDVHSSGAIVRLGMSVLAAAVFAFIALRARLPEAHFRVWAICSGVVVALFALAFLRSTLADRLGLFFLALQLHAFSTLPTLFLGATRRLVETAVILVSGAAFWVWLNFGTHAESWLPYRSALWP